MDDGARVLGVDACKAGWVGIALGCEGPEAYVGATISALVEQAGRHGELRVVGIDIPIGLPDSGRRAADVLARAAIGPRRSSVFMTPVRAALQAPDHADAVSINRRLAGEGASVQAFGLRTKLFEVERFVRSTTLPVLEVHPEVCFARMQGQPLISRKSTWAGSEARRALLRTHGVELSGELGMSGLDVGVDDVLDAGAVAWTARRWAAGEAMSLPDPPEVFSDGWRAAIWV